jgi:hypothetical protein
MKKETLEKHIEEQLTRFENAVELTFNEEVGKKMPFVRDGILNIETYLNAPVKILYILKEVNNPDGDLLDMRPCLLNLNETDSDRVDAGWGNTWRPIAYATYGIFKKMNFQEIQDTIGDINGNAAEILKYMPNIAQINVKKYAGGSRTNKQEIREFYNNYKDLLHEQIDIINPDVLIFCGTLEFFNDNGFSNWGMRTICVLAVLESGKTSRQKWQQ